MTTPSADGDSEAFSALENTYNRQRHRNEKLYLPMKYPPTPSSPLSGSQSDSSPVKESRSRIQARKEIERLRIKLKSSKRGAFRERAFANQSKADMTKEYEKEYEQLIEGLTYDQLIEEEREVRESLQSPKKVARTVEDELEEFQQALDDYELLQELEIAEMLSQVEL